MFFEMIDTETGSKTWLELSEKQEKAMRANNDTIVLYGSTWKYNFKKLLTPPVESQTKYGELDRSLTNALSCHPDQVSEFRQHYSGIHPGIEIKNNGDMVCKSRSARRAAIRANGMFDKGGGYNDP